MVINHDKNDFTPPTRPERFAKRPVSCCKTGHSGTQNGPFCNAERPVLQISVIQLVTQYDARSNIILQNEGHQHSKAPMISVTDLQP